MAQRQGWLAASVKVFGHGVWRRCRGFRGFRAFENVKGCFRKRAQKFLGLRGGCLGRCGRRLLGLHGGCLGVARVAEEVVVVGWQRHRCCKVASVRGLQTRCLEALRGFRGFEGAKKRF